MTADLLKGLHTSVAATAAVIVALYLPALWHGLRQALKNRSWFLMLGIICAWAGTASLYGWLAMLYWLHDIEPVLQTNTPLPLRLAWLAMMLTGGAIHIACTQRERLGVWPTFWLWSGAVAAFTFAVEFGR